MIKKQGFSLIEILIVIVLIGIIAVIALPNLVKSKDGAYKISMISDLRNLISAQETYYMNNSHTYSSTTAALNDYKTSDGNTVSLSSGSGNRGWHADVLNDNLETTKFCSIFVGVDSGGDQFEDTPINLVSGSKDSEIKCSGF